MTDKEITLKNLKHVLETLPKLAKEKPAIIHDFDMRQYGVFSLCETGATTPCQTVGCLLGNSELCFPEIIPECYHESSFLNGTYFSELDFVRKVYPYLSGQMGLPFSNTLFSFLFAAAWSGYQPTFEQAMQRLKYAIDHDLELPEWNYQLEPFI